MFGARGTDEAHEDLDGSRHRSPRMDARERLRRGLRPEANPGAFWQAVGGRIYVAIGLMIVVIWS